MKIFPFDDEQLKALKMMAPHIVDLQNTGLIYKVFSFDSERIRLRKSSEIADNHRIKEGCDKTIIYKISGESDISP